MSKRPQLLVLTTAVVLMLVLLNLPSQAAARIKFALSGFFLPLFGLTSSTEQLVDAAGLRALPKGVLIAEVEHLRRENEELKLQATESAEVARENEVLRQAVSWQPRIPWRRRLVRVISRDPENWWRTILIDAGTRDGMVKNLPVVTPLGLVGRIEEPGLFSSRVVLLGDPMCRVAAVVDNETRDTGAVVPGEASVLDESIVELKYLKAKSAAIPGQRVFTSGLGGIFPKGIPIGEIIQTNSVDFGLYLDARIKLAANLSELEEVWVLLP